MAQTIVENQVQQERYRHIDVNGRLASLIHLVYALLWWLLFSNNDLMAAPTLWLLGIFVVSLLRIFIVKRARSFKNDVSTPIFGIACSSGLVWAIGILILMPALSGDMRLMLLLMCLALLSSVVFAFTLSRRAINGFCLPPLLALLICLDYSNRLELAAMMVVLFNYSFILLSTRRAMLLLDDNMQRLFRHQAQVEELESSQQKMLFQSQYDQLTRLHNRHHYEEQLEHYWSLCQRANSPLSVILIDVDFFKPFNDAYGHVAGDRCLSEIAALLKRAMIRRHDVLARYGGEEFVIVLPNTDAIGAQTLIQRIQKLIFEAHIQHQYSKVSNQVTVSMGVCCMIPSAQQSARQLVEKADQALYKAKETGRNCFVISGRGEQHEHARTQNRRVN
ncbi:GGDEF domain-containing protein [Alginatibacterium sediminis]|uniref:diguanylate cyclase n=1 Tax=Alginatibacterium sediminis TaxID=2164068 RepID=A0A420ENE6_9ALTE|nr:GGDEF domain-containing protein [Alginatibacterium sediminis]RKF22210.1 GGDEF domain-containing protein [Alginatibacterium sediminis]